MAATIDLGLLERLLDAQHDLLCAVASLSVDCSEVEGEYRRRHGELETLLHPRQCFCRWDSVWSWFSEALSLGDGFWQEWLVTRAAPYRALLAAQPLPAKYRLGRHRVGGDKRNRPYDRWLSRLDPDKRIAVDKAVTNQLAVLGKAVAKDRRMGRWITRDRARTEAPRILEFKVQVDAADLPLENPDGSPRDSGYPKRKIELRVFCCFSEDDSTIVLFDGHDKGEDPNGQEAAIEAAFAALSDYRGQEDRARKAAARAPRT
ncbi:MAG: hypothetical protein ACYC8T_32615 [Myxococcaceae bacterium]